MKMFSKATLVYGCERKVLTFVINIWCHFTTNLINIIFNEFFKQNAVIYACKEHPF
jgi:hypothetical protein